MIRTRNILAVAAVVLAACGSDKGSGGGGGGIDIQYTGSTSTATISTASAGSILSSAGGGIVAVSGMTGTASMYGVVGAAGRPSLKEAMARIGAARRDYPAAFAGAVTTDSAACPGGGSMTVTVNDQDNDPATTQSGDYAQITWNSCTDAYAERIVGSIRLDIVSTDAADFLSDPSLATNDYTYQVTLTFTDWAFIDTTTGDYFGIDGDISFSFKRTNNVLTYTISGTSLAAAGSSSGQTSSFLLTGPGGTGEYSDVYAETYGYGLGYSATEESYDFDGRVCTSEMNGCLDLVTSSALKQYATQSYPDAGTFRVSAGTPVGDPPYVQVTATNGATGAITVVYDLGAGPHTNYTTWSCFDQHPDDSSVCLPN